MAAREAKIQAAATILEILDDWKSAIWSEWGFTDVDRARLIAAIDGLATLLKDEGEK